ncbi:MAG: arginine--tRNA ligase [Holosporales bacterium]|jgi:arginyl-tRNA synthetase|nr:arginine--tRNA ligase [Holosporales bacterium]
MPLLKLIREQLTSAIQLLSNDVDTAKVQVELTQNVNHGDITTNAAMVLCKFFELSPKRLAEKLVEKIKNFEEVDKVEIAGNGFINMTLKHFVWTDELKKIVALGKNYSATNIANNQTVHIEFVSANPTGPMHTGHVRNAVLGDTIAALLHKVGYKVYREYYINDAGRQIDCLARSVYLRYLEALGQTLPLGAFEGDVYPGEYLIPVGKEIADRDGDKWINKAEGDWLAAFKTFSVNAMMQLIRNDLTELGIIMDCYTSEKVLADTGKIQDAVAVLEKNGDIYTGTLVPPQGKVDEDWEVQPQTLFRSTKYGDEIDRSLRKSNGSWTYFAGDIAYHFDKYSRGFTQLINVLGADHCGYVTRLKAAVTAITNGNASLNIKLFQIVNFFENGIPVKMSKRAGTFITAHDLVSRVGKDATRFMMISRHHRTIIDFDFKKVLELSHDNPVFYVQYAHARICSVFRHALSVFGLSEDVVKDTGHIEIFTEQAEIAVIKCLANWPQVVEQSAINQEPHRITNYLYTLAGVFHCLWNHGKESTRLRFIDVKNKTATREKLFLLIGVATVLRDGLELLGITPVEEMK